MIDILPNLVISVARHRLVKVRLIDTQNQLDQFLARELQNIVGKILRADRYPKTVRGPKLALMLAS